MKKLRQFIILNDDASKSGGGSAVAIAQAVGLYERGYQVRFMAAYGNADPRLEAIGKDHIYILGQENLHHMSHPLKAMIAGLWNPSPLKKLKDWMDDFPGQSVVIVHGWTKRLSSSVMLYPLIKKCPVFLTAHEYFITCPNGAFYLHQEQQRCPLTPMSAGCLLKHCDRRSYVHKLYRILRTFMNKQLFRIPARLNGILAVSKFSADYLKRHLPASTRVHIVRNPVDHLSRRQVHVANNKLFLFVGRIEKEKGAAFFAEAARRAGVQASFVGEGSLSTDLSKEYEEFKFHGWQSPEKVNELMQSARTLVFPSLWPETQGLVVLEALSLGIPVLTTGQHAASLEIKHKENGWILRNSQLDEFVDLLVEANCEPQITSMGDKAYRGYWNNPFTAKRHLDELICVIESSRATRTV